MIDSDGRLSDAELVDRLVDGELDEPTRRQVLERLDVEPGAWRRCALAFLEAQCFREGLSAVAVPSGGRPWLVSRSARRWLGRGAAAAAVVAAFALGRVVTSGSHASVPLDPPNDQVANVPPDELRMPTGSTEFVALRLGDELSGAEADLRVPLLSPRATDPAWRWLEDAVIAEELIQAIAAAGHEVVERRHLIPLDLEDGRQAIVPVDEIEVHPVVHRRYY
jgi:hypothetical protein